MGQYNPHAPYIVGQEWVPIRQANYKPDKVTEQGYTFHLDHVATPITGAFYVAEVPESRVNQVSDLISVYSAGSEDLTGPVKVINIPASAIWTTGTALSVTEGVTALQNPSDGLSLRFNGLTDSNTYIGISFDVNSYSQQLMGKRILDVSFRYSWLVGQPSDAADINVAVGFAKNMFSQAFFYFFDLQTGTTGGNNEIASFSLSALNPYWDATRDIYQVHDIYPWRFQELKRFASTEAASSRMLLQFFNNLSSDMNAFLYFCDMQVTYCEETRILYGGRKTRSLQNTSGTATPSWYEKGPNLVRLLDTNLATATTALSPGEYSVTLTHDELPIDSTSVGAADVCAVRELYPVAQHGLVINKTLVPDDEFTKEETPVITEITLHTAAAVVTGVHPYGIQNEIPVYGTITAIQEIEDDPVGTAKSFPHVRFYARRFGRTTVPLALVDVATGLSTVSISTADFDALPEIVDGWREVNLTFSVPPSFATAAGDIDWRWQATSELARNQWQVLGAGSSAFAAHSIGLASYYAPQGNTVSLTWQSPVISGTADDTLSDAVLIFSQDPPAVTGFVIETLTQEVTGSGGACGLPHGCIPTGIDYNYLSWPFPTNSAYFLDEFSRVSASGWGSDWLLSAGASEYTINGSYASITPGGSGANFNATVAVGSNFDITADLGIGNAVVATSTARSGLIGRFTDNSNYYLTEVQTAVSGVVTIVFVRRVAGTDTTMVTITLPTNFTNNAGGWLRARFMGQDDRFKFKIWHLDEDQPEGWLFEETNTALTTGSRAGVYARTSVVTGNIFNYDNFTVTPPSFWFGKYEIQRRDAITDWQTVMETTSPAVTGFSDYEARVGMASEYRIRQCNVLDFCGSIWVTGSGTIPSPGVDVTGSGNSVLIFTSNESPEANLAYAMQFEGQPIETFVFPEADEVQLQRMYGKDFFTAFHPLERGGAQFTRVLLVNAAAIAAPSLADFQNLRDLAWDELNYVCVRDELGNRWFANIIIPDGNVRMNRTIYLAQIQVSEVTSTPTPIDVEP